MLKRLFLILSVAALSLVSAETYKITLYQDSYLGDQEIKAGQYKLEVATDKVTLSKGKKSVEAPAKMENTENTNSSTTVQFTQTEGKYRIREIRLGGTNKKLVIQM